MQLQFIKITAPSMFVARCVDTSAVLTFSVGRHGTLDKATLSAGQTLAFADVEFVPRANVLRGAVADEFLYKRKQSASRSH